MIKRIVSKIDLILLHYGLLFYASLLFDRLFFFVFYKHYYKKRFKYYGENVRWGRYSLKYVIPHTVLISNPQKIHIGDNCQFDEHCYLQCHHDGDELFIGNGVRVNAFSHIQAYSSIVIEDNVLIAPFAHINSGNHGFADSDVPIMFQEYEKGGGILIKHGTWLGRNVHILGDVSIGKNCVIGAGSVVTKSYDDYSVIVGNPSRLVRKIK